VSEFLTIGDIGTDISIICEVIQASELHGAPQNWTLSAEFKRVKSSNSVPAIGEENDAEAQIAFMPDTGNGKAGFSFNFYAADTANLEPGIYWFRPKFVFANNETKKQGPFYVRVDR
jgi:hypothetical protein